MHLITYGAWDRGSEKMKNLLQSFYTLCFFLICVLCGNINLQRLNKIGGVGVDWFSTLLPCVLKHTGIYFSLLLLISQNHRSNIMSSKTGFDPCFSFVQSFQPTYSKKCKHEPAFVQAGTMKKSMIREMFEVRSDAKLWHLVK